MLAWFFDRAPLGALFEEILELGVQFFCLSDFLTGATAVYGGVGVGGGKFFANKKISVYL